MLAAFLAFIENDITARPESVSPVSKTEMLRALDLVKGVIASDDEDVQVDL